VSFTQLSHSNSAIAYGDLSDVIARIQKQFHQLGWNTQQVVQFVSENFVGKQRSQLTDDELVGLLYRLRTRSL
jgi:hypothetical protein